MHATRRQFVVAGASAALGGSFLLTRETGSQAKDSPNVLVVMVDTLRADHAYGKRARTPNIDVLAAAGLSFTRVVPEAMPTVPTRNSFLSGRRHFPYRGWRDHRGLMSSPGWSPLEDVETAWTSVLKRAGYWTGYVTDNPFLGFSSPYERLRRSFDLFESRGGQVGGRATGVSERELLRWLHPALRDEHNADRMRRYISNGGYDEDETKSFAARVFTSGVEALERAARQRPFALVVDTFEPHEPWTPPKRYLDMYGDPDWRGPEPGTLRYGRTDRWLTGDEAPAVLKRLRALYAAEVTMTDRWLGVLLERLGDLGLAEDTVIVLVADHGIFIGEHGWTGKISVALHPELVHVPLIVVDPSRRRAGRRARTAPRPMTSAGRSCRWRAWGRRARWRASTSAGCSTARNLRGAHSPMAATRTATTCALTTGPSSPTTGWRSRACSTTAGTPARPVTWPRDTPAWCGRCMRAWPRRRAGSSPSIRSRIGGRR